MLRTQALAKYGSYEGYLQLQGLPKEYFEDLDIKVGEGRLPGNDQNLTFFYGCQVLQDFYNAKGSGGSYWQTGVLPDIDLMKDPIFVIFDMDAYYASGTPDENGQTQKPPKKYLIETCGVEASPGEDEWSQYGWYTYCDIDELIKELKKIFKKRKNQRLL